MSAKIAARLALVAALAAPSRSARAFEDQASLDVAAGYTLVTDAPALTHAGGLDLGGSLGLGSVWCARALLGGGLWSSPRGPARPEGRALAELSYTFDVLSVVPSLGLGGSVSLLARPDAEPREGAAVIGGPHLVLGLDYLVSRRVNFGLDLREALLFGVGRPSFASELRLRTSVLFELF